ncbi:translation elongation factor Ts [Sciscionella marina]|uniref:translation elongation factor Ts n=1 Tax=Sciscionella marina TaxID=508770 RepID=UPI00035E2859|nr:translation elongation factor Ts [Sciscionella marina]
MANYSAADVKRLREATGSGMMDCKKALEEAEGDFDKAVEILRVKGAKDVGKRAERTTAQGLIAVAGPAMVELNSETDFVAKNPEFVALADRIVATARDNRIGELDALLAAELDGAPVSEAIAALSAKIGEKLELRRITLFDGNVTSYLHRRSADLPPAVGVLVEYTGSDEEAARGAAMQVAALNARYTNREDVPEETVANERRIAEQTAREEGKPEQAMPKIVEGKVNAYYKDFVLNEQPSVTDNKKTVKAVLDEAGVSVVRFARFEVGVA